MSDTLQVVPTATAIEYTVADGEPLHLDLYVPDQPGPHPVCLCLHGGAWFLGDRTTGAHPFATGIAARGIATASVDYRLGEAGAFPANIDDVRAVVRWLRAHGDTYGLVTEKIGSWGVSAGGHLSLMAASGPLAVSSATGSTPSSTATAPPTWLPGSRALVWTVRISSGHAPPARSTSDSTRRRRHCSSTAIGISRWCWTRVSVCTKPWLPPDATPNS
jgi:acetyl esterase/lipase